MYFISGTVRGNCTGLPQAVVGKHVKLKRGEKVFRRKGNLLCLKWVDKRPVAMLSSIHNAVETQVKIDYFGQPVIKPFVVHNYNLNMGGVDTSDKFLSHYITPKCFKWSKKLLLHLISMIILNAYILNRKYGTKKMSHSAYREYIAHYLITTSLEMATCTKKKPPVPIDNTETRLSGKHFISKLDTVVGSKRKAPARKCKVCNFTCEQLTHYSHNNLHLSNKDSSYGCKTCSNINLCITPCFKIFHSQVNYREQALAKRINELL